MRAREFIQEKLKGDENYTLPVTYVLPGLTNQDAYLQYRMGMKLAASGPQQKSDLEQSPWGENMVVTAYSSGEQEILDAALKSSHQSSKAITTAKSEEPKHINKASPIAPKKKNKYGV